MGPACRKELPLISGILVTHLHVGPQLRPYEKSHTFLQLHILHIFAVLHISSSREFTITNSTAAADGVGSPAALGTLVPIVDHLQLLPHMHLSPVVSQGGGRVLWDGGQPILKHITEGGRRLLQTLQILRDALQPDANRNLRTAVNLRK